jgi:hypothetical protein
MRCAWREDVSMVYKLGEEMSIIPRINNIE